MSPNAPPPKVETFSMASMFGTSISPKVSYTPLSYQYRDTSTRIVNPIRSIQQQGRRARKAAFSRHQVYQNGNLTVKPSFICKLCEWSSSNDISVTVDAFARNTSQSVVSRHFGKRRGGALGRNWSDECFRVHPPPHLYRRTVTKILWEGCQGFMVLPTLKPKWWWMMGEFAVDWVEIPAGSKAVFQSPEGVLITVPEGQSLRLVYFDASQSSLHDDDDAENDHRLPDPYGDPD